MRKNRMNKGKENRSGKGVFMLCAALLLAVCTVLGGCGGGGDSARTQKPQSTSAGVDDVLKAGVEEYDSGVPVKTEDDQTAEAGYDLSGEVDVDLTALSSTIVYSEVFNMVSNPDDYIGKTVRMEGPCSIYYDEASGIYYYACIIQDATACCAQGMEFELDETYDRPEDYPEEGEEVVVEGTFDTYMENGYLYCTLRDGQLIDG